MLEMMVSVFTTQAIEICNCIPKNQTKHKTSALQFRIKYRYSFFISTHCTFFCKKISNIEQILYLIPIYKINTYGEEDIKERVINSDPYTTDPCLTLLSMSVKEAVFGQTGEYSKVIVQLLSQGKNTSRLVKGCSVA